MSVEANGPEEKTMARWCHGESVETEIIHLIPQQKNWTWKLWFYMQNILSLMHPHPHPLQPRMPNENNQEGTSQKKARHIHGDFGFSCNYDSPLLFFLLSSFSSLISSLLLPSSLSFSSLSPPPPFSSHSLSPFSFLPPSSFLYPNTHFTFMLFLVLCYALWCTEINTWQRPVSLSLPAISLWGASLWMDDYNSSVNTVIHLQAPKDSRGRNTEESAAGLEPWKDG